MTHVKRRVPRVGVLWRFVAPTFRVRRDPWARVVTTEDLRPRARRRTLRLLGVTESGGLTSELVELRRRSYLDQGADRF